jgi:mono/diheme cytochrome c family protein
MLRTIFSWIAGLALVLLFLVIVSPDVFRGYVYSTEQRSSGERVYQTYCIGCHGADGAGNGAAADMLNPKPRNFVDGEYKYFHFGEAGPLPSDESMQITVRNGLPGSSMPAFPLLTEQEIRDVTNYVKSLREGGWGESQPIQAASGVVPIEGETAEELFKNAACYACHALEALDAAGGVGPALDDIGARLSYDEIVESIVEPTAVIASVCPAGPCPEAAMPQNFGERLSEEQVDTLASFLSEQQ